jgi:hypothetical protein
VAQLETFYPRNKQVAAFSSGLPGGNRNNNGNFNNVGNNGNWWTSTENNNNAWNRNLNYNNPEVNRNNNNKENGFSVRCLRDWSETSGLAGVTACRALFMRKCSLPFHISILIPKNYWLTCSRPITMPGKTNEIPSTP